MRVANEGSTPHTMVLLLTPWFYSSHHGSFRQAGPARIAVT